VPARQPNSGAGLRPDDSAAAAKADTAAAAFRVLWLVARPGPALSRCCRLQNTGRRARRCLVEWYRGFLGGIGLASTSQTHGLA
jgi:hypothetical protein